VLDWQAKGHKGKKKQHKGQMLAEPLVEQEERRESKGAQETPPNSKCERPMFFCFFVPAPLSPASV